MEKDRVLFDASSYVLYEASGDSEAQHFGGDLESQLHSDAAVIAAEEDDAQSCSYGSLSGSAGKEDDGGDGDENLRCADSDGDCIAREEEEDDGGGSDLEDGVVDQCRVRGNAAKEKLEKSKGCEDSSVKNMMSERDGDRLFWEACLASHE